MFKIRHKKTGRYSKGGSDVEFNGAGQGWAKEAGKVWLKIGHVRNHINMIVGYKGVVPVDWEVVQYEVVEKSVSPIADHVDMIKLLKRKGPVRAY